MQWIHLKFSKEGFKVLDKLDKILLLKKINLCVLYSVVAHKKNKSFIVLKNFYGLELGYNYEQYDNSKTFDKKKTKKKNTFIFMLWIFL